MAELTLLLGNPAARGARALRYGALAAVAAVLLGWPFVLDDTFYLHVATLVALYAIGAASLHLILRTGHLSMGHAAFLGFGAYGSVLTTMKLGWPFPLAMLAGVALSCLVALAIGPVLLRIKGVYFVLVTFTFGEVVRLVFVNWISVTGGSNGIYQVPPPHPFFMSNLAYYYFALAFAFVCTLVVRRILRSELGRVIDSIGESEQLAESSGVPVIRFRIMVFVISCGMVAVQGSLQAHFIRYIAPNSFTFMESVNFLVMNVVGGMNSLAGPLIGALFIVPLPEFLRGWVQYQQVMYGVILIAVMAFLPGGLVGVVDQLRGGLDKKRKETGR